MNETEYSKRLASTFKLTIPSDLHCLYWLIYCQHVRLCLFVYFSDTDTGTWDYNN